MNALLPQFPLNLYNMYLYFLKKKNLDGLYCSDLLKLQSEVPSVCLLKSNFWEAPVNRDLSIKFSTYSHYNLKHQLVYVDLSHGAVILFVHSVAYLMTLTREACGV